MFNESIEFLGGFHTNSFSKDVVQAEEKCKRTLKSVNKGPTFAELIYFEKSIALEYLPTFGVTSCIKRVLQKRTTIDSF